MSVLEAYASYNNSKYTQITDFPNSLIRDFSPSNPSPSRHTLASSINVCPCCHKYVSNISTNSFSPPYNYCMKVVKSH